MNTRYFWLILACFVDYYSLFWGPGVISTINKPWDALRVDHQHSQFRPIRARFVALAVLADSGPFRGLLLTVLGSRSDFHD